MAELVAELSTNALQQSGVQSKLKGSKQLVQVTHLLARSL